MNEPGGLSASGRFDRVEAALLRIENKLDAKADRSDVSLLLHRIEAVENGTTPLASLYLKQFSDLSGRVENLEEKGSRNAREAVELGHELKKQVDSLLTANNQQTAVMQNNGTRMAARNRDVMLVVGIITALNAVITGLAALGIFT